MVRAFIKETTNVGGSIGIIIPKEVCFAEEIGKFQRVRIIIERINEPQDQIEIANPRKSRSVAPSGDDVPCQICYYALERSSFLGQFLRFGGVS